MPELPVVLLMTSNGVGMGHLSRQLTLALSGPQQFRPVILSLSKALPRVIAATRSGELPGARARAIRHEYCPSRESGWLPERGWRRSLRTRYRSYRWHPYLRDRVVSLVAETRATAVVFDGVVPYQGLLDARDLLPEVPFTWVRRGLWRPQAPTRQLTAGSRFDLVIEPGDLGAAADRGPLTSRSDATQVPPVSLTDVLPPTSRQEARATLGLPPDGPTLLLAPGSGALGSVEEAADLVLEELARSGPRWTVAVTRQSIAQHAVGRSSEHVVVLDDVYPLSRHLAAFDAAVSAAGYNSVHELLGAGVPTLLVPSVHHVTDDQEARARGVAARGAALLAADGDLPRAVRSLLDDHVRQDLRAGCATLGPLTGGAAAAAEVGRLAARGRPTAQPVLRPAPGRPLLDARTTTGPGGGVDLRFTEQVTVADVRGPDPVEHLLPGSSEDYRAARRRTAGWLYRTA
jgi:UDP-N-acetylglucosamine--N-acetylmuramyl-(pentapeptide) pyrophosphoryl-undecaprenol N-acetylglucosamine transferase